MKKHGAKQRQHSKLGKRSGIKLFLMASPLLLLVFLFSYLPLSGWVYALFNYKPGRPLLDCQFVGLKNFTRVFSDSYYFEDIVRVMKNTLGMSLLHMAGTILPMFFAILISEIKCMPFRKLAQTLTTIPNFISWVLVYAIAYAMFSPDDGFLNRILVQLGILEQGVNFLASSKHIWLKMWLWGVWKGLGWGAIVYIAAIAGIDREQYEAAEVDGAGRFQKMLHITIPGLMPTFFVMLIMSIGNLINTGVDQYFVFQNAMNKESIEVLDLYVYNQGILGVNYSYSTAIGILKSVVSVVLFFVANVLSKMIRKQSVF